LIVLDASAAVEWLLDTRLADRIHTRLFSAGSGSLNAPHLIDVEVTQLLRRYAAMRVITSARGQEAVQDLLDLPLERHPHDLFLPRIWALRQNVTAYDAAYIALAEALDATLITCDEKLAVAPGHAARIETVRAGA
jgi:predicted nucleic acid-binding protein